jgi:hypothetical protein
MKRQNKKLQILIFICSLFLGETVKAIVYHVNNNERWFCAIFCENEQDYVTRIGFDENIAADEARQVETGQHEEIQMPNVFELISEILNRIF